MIKLSYTLEGLDCGNCAAKLERALQKMEGLFGVTVNFMAMKLSFECDFEKQEEIEAKVRQVAMRIEPDIVLTLVKDKSEKKKKVSESKECNCGHDHYEHHHEENESCECGHDHHEHHHEVDKGCDCGQDHPQEKQADYQGTKQQYTLKLTGLDCANCAAKIENELQKNDKLDYVSVDFMTQTMKLASHFTLEEIFPSVVAIVKKTESDVHVEIQLVNKKELPQEKESRFSDPKKLVQIGISILFLIAGFMLMQSIPTLSTICFVISYLVVGLEILYRAIRNIFKGQVFDENFLMAIATVGAIAIGDLAEGVTVILFYQVGEYFQNAAVRRSRKSISSLMDIRPDYANVLRNGNVIRIAPEEVMLDEIIVIRPGEKVPLDGIVIKGESALDTSALTGESLPRDISVGQDVISGCINRTGLIEVKVTKEFTESTVSKILDLVENASSKKSPSENFITKFARYYTPIVVLIAAVLGLILPFIIPGAQFADYFHRALTFLVISCPCALVISIPLTFFAGIGGLSKQGILVKGSNYLEVLSKVDTVVFDKTGTLSQGIFGIDEIVSEQPEEMLQWAAYTEANSSHPISQCIVKAYGKEIVSSRLSDVQEIAGHGVVALVDGHRVVAGNKKMMEANQIESPKVEEAGTIVYVALDGQYLGYLLIRDQLKVDSQDAIAKLKQNGVRQCVMMTGDNDAVAKQAASVLKIDQVYSELLPDQKVERMEQLLKTKQKDGKLAFVGDGINDAPVLSLADIGIAMGSLGSDAAIEAADVVIMNDQPSKIVTAIKGARKTKKIVLQNIVLALLIKFGVLLLGAFGYATMWEAVFADVGVSVLAILNAIRALNIKD